MPGGLVRGASGSKTSEAEAAWHAIERDSTRVQCALAHMWPGSELPGTALNSDTED